MDLPRLDICASQASSMCVAGIPNSFFMLAINNATVVLGHQYCFPTLLLPCTRGLGGFEDQLMFSKFQVALDLLKQGQDFALFETDVWLFRLSFPSFSMNWQYPCWLP